VNIKGKNHKVKKMRAQLHLKVGVRTQMPQKKESLSKHCNDMKEARE